MEVAIRSDKSPARPKRSPSGERRSIRSGDEAEGAGTRLPPAPPRTPALCAPLRPLRRLLSPLPAAPPLAPHPITAAPPAGLPPKLAERHDGPSGSAKELDGIDMGGNGLLVSPSCPVEAHEQRQVEHTSRGSRA